MTTSKIFIYNKPFEGLPKRGDILLKEEKLPPTKDGEFLAEAVYLSVDPYMRGYARILPLGSVYIGSQIAKILESQHPDYPVGRHVVGPFGWRTHTISSGQEVPGFGRPYLVPEIDDVPLSYFLGVMGRVGSSAYFGFLEICQPKEGETVVVSGAAGAVGCIVGQIAKIKGCTVIGIAGSEEKGKWLVEDLGFDHFINYKTANIDRVLTRIAPQGVDCYFDNVGGKTSNIVFQHMNSFGRISLCGSISLYNEKNMTAPYQLITLIGKQVKMEGFLVSRWHDRYEEGEQQILKWLKEDKLKYRETVTEGFENMFEAFVGMLQGKNIGKAVVKA